MKTHCVCCGLRTTNTALFRNHRGDVSRLPCCIKCEEQDRNKEPYHHCSHCGGELPGTPEYLSRQREKLEATR